MMNDGSNGGVRETLSTLFEAAHRTAHPSVCLPAHLPPVPKGGRIIVIGAGKGSAAMAVAAEAHYIATGQENKISGLISTRHGFGLPTGIIKILEAGHPVPDANSIVGAERAIALAKSAGPNDLVLCLLSGGASAIWAAPVQGVSFEAKQALTKQLLKSGAPISEMNCVRKHLSEVKGGKLAAAVYPARLLTLAISDVPGDNPDEIGSGPTVADRSTLADARAVLEKWKITPSPEIAKALADPANETLKAGDPRLANSTYEIVAAPRASIEAAATIARELGYRVVSLGDDLEGEARDVARAHAEMALEAKRKHEKVAIMSGGELTVTVRGDGSGGPNQEYALGLALALDGATGIAGLAGDTDGIDGGGGNAGDPAGALVFPDTLKRAKAANLNAAKFLENNDSTGFFRPLGDLILCGPTQTNVNDFRVILIDP
ncbi:glycerate 2-kinase [Hyphomicrobium facile]|uniref:Glycerate 2-kinase n=2 Tax=Hyphomicrobium facile TaxID=51670 RepID=A0A1I7MWS1_9HYPH|nr:glycerate 2-kinase [Hyphomicrobium facile]